MKYTLKLMLGLVLCTSNCLAVEKVFARATKYHKTDRNCDTNTLKGITSTQVRLGDSCDNTIGMVAIDPQRIPFGSLIYSPQAKRFFIACDVGGDVSARTAAKELAKKKGLPDKYHNALVLDFYAPREIIDNHFDYFYIIKHEGDSFRFEMNRSEQYRRLDPKFWLSKVKKIAKKDKRHHEELMEIIHQLQDMS